MGRETEPDMEEIAKTQSLKMAVENAQNPESLLAALREAGVQLVDIHNPGNPEAESIEARLEAARLWALSLEESTGEELTDVERSVADAKSTVAEKLQLWGKLDRGS